MPGLEAIREVIKVELGYCDKGLGNRYKPVSDGFYPTCRLSSVYGELTFRRILYRPGHHF